MFHASHINCDFWLSVLSKSTCFLTTGFVAKSKYKIQALFKDFQGPKLHFSSTKIINKKPYPRRGDSKFRQQCDTEVYCTHQYRNDKSKWQIAISKQAKWNQILFPSTGDMHTSACLKIVNKINAKFQNLQDLNSRTFHVLSSTLSVFKHFQGPWSFYSKFKHFQGFLKHAMNPVTITTPLSTSGSC